MEKTLADLSPDEFEELIGRVIDRKLEVWFTQFIDALSGVQGGEEEALRPEFATSLRRSLEQAHSGDSMNLKAFRDQIGR